MHFVLRHISVDNVKAFFYYYFGGTITSFSRKYEMWLMPKEKYKPRQTCLECLKLILLLTPVPELGPLCFHLAVTSNRPAPSFWSTNTRQLTVELVRGALSVGCLGGQEQGLVVQIAVWGGRFVVRPEFRRTHVAAQGEQRLA